MQLDIAQLTTSKIEDGLLQFTPIVNRNASTVDRVYDLYSIISKSELESLKKLAEKIQVKHVISEP